jgi:seryl-tRNA synthetase
MYMTTEINKESFSTEDIAVLKRALHTYLVTCMRTEGYSDRDPHPDLSVTAGLLRQLGHFDSISG